MGLEKGASPGAANAQPLCSSWSGRVRCGTRCKHGLRLLLSSDWQVPAEQPCHPSVASTAPLQHAGHPPSHTPATSGASPTAR